MPMAAAPPASRVDILQSVVLFHALPRETLEALAAATVERAYAGGAMVIRRGEPGDGLYIVVAGLVQVVGDEDDIDASVLAVLGPGEAFGELALLDGKPRSASVIAAWPARCLFLARDAFLAHLDQHPEAARALLRVLAGRLREMDRRLTQRS
jgi:CRP/FNR family cyclic AMP-dependent transcriptional regulator